MKTVISSLVVLVFASLGAGLSEADIIDFETGFQRLDPVTSVTTASNTLKFSTAGGSDVFVANVDIPKDGFEKVVTDGLVYDIPAGGNPGQYFATHGPHHPGDYLFDFATPVTSFNLDLYDYRGDGGAGVTDFATLLAFSDAQRLHQVASDRYVIPVPHPEDGLVTHLSVSSPLIAALTLQFSTPDRGTGIDNIQFSTVPEGASSGLLLLGILGMLSRVRGRRLVRTS